MFSAVTSTRASSICLPRGYPAFLLSGEVPSSSSGRSISSTSAWSSIKSSGLTPSSTISDFSGSITKSPITKVYDKCLKKTYKLCDHGDGHALRLLGSKRKTDKRGCKLSSYFLQCFGKHYSMQQVTSLTSSTVTFRVSTSLFKHKPLTSLLSTSFNASSTLPSSKTHLSMYFFLLA